MCNPEFSRFRPSFEVFQRLGLRALEATFRLVFGTRCSTLVTVSQTEVPDFTR